MEDFIKKSNEEKFNVVKGIDLIKRVKAEPDPKFVWGGIPECSKGLIAGAPKTGKTTFAENLAICLAVGKKSFFGSKMDGVPRKVLFVNLEESYKLRSRRNAKQLEALSTHEYNLFCENYISTPDDFPSYFNSDEDWGLLRNYIIACEADIIFIDSLSHLFVGEIEKSSTAQSFFQKFKKYTDDLEKTIVIIHHTTKGNKEPIATENIAGSRVIIQEFEYAYGMARVPSEEGGSYLTLLENKHIPSDDNKANLYSINQIGWVEKIGEDNKFNLYKPNKQLDGRVNDENKTQLLNYFEDQSTSTTSTTSTIPISELKNYFTEGPSKSMVESTLYYSIKGLLGDGSIKRVKKGVYMLNS